MIQNRYYELKRRLMNDAMKGPLTQPNHIPNNAITDVFFPKHLQEIHLTGVHDSFCWMIHWKQFK